MSNNTLINKVDFKRSFSLQWHLTALCDQKCKHCYVTDERTYSNEITNPLNLENCKQVIDDLLSFCKILRANAHIAFTGGDPLLRKDFFNILEYARENEIECSILGNPYNLTENGLKRLKKLDIRNYQISIDGLRITHDSFRMEGSFKASIEAIKKLKKNNIRTDIMFSISKINANELIPIMQLADKLDVDVFAFARVCGLGSGIKVLEDEFTPEEYRQILLDAFYEAERLKSSGSKTKFSRKDHLYTLLMTELGILEYKPNEDNVIYGGCSIGCRSMCVLADGTVFACRRFYSPIGKIPEQTINEVFLSDDMNKYRDTKFVKCSKCDLFQICRGCPAVAYGKTGNYGSADPQCWKNV